MITPDEVQGLWASTPDYSDTARAAPPTQLPVATVVVDRLIPAPIKGTEVPPAGPRGVFSYPPVLIYQVDRSIYNNYKNLIINIIITINYTYKKLIITNLLSFVNLLAGKGRGVVRNNQMGGGE